MGQGGFVRKKQWESWTKFRDHWREMCKETRMIGSSVIFTKGFINTVAWMFD